MLSTLYPVFLAFCTTGLIVFVIALIVMGARP